jgi:hypothetical protein
MIEARHIVGNRLRRLQGSDRFCLTPGLICCRTCAGGIGLVAYAQVGLRA